MHTGFKALAVAGVLGLAACQPGAPLDVSSADKEAALQQQCLNALNELFTEVDGSKTIVDNAKGTVVFPDLTSAGFIFGAETGNGCLVQDGKVVSYYNKSGVSFGFTAGAQSVSQAVVLNSDAAMAKLTSAAGLDFGANASATLVSTGASGSINTRQLMTQEILVFVWGETGLMASADINGTKITEISFDS
jgi:lipid-binding SYLF domain-containing protein